MAQLKSLFRDASRLALLTTPTLPRSTVAEELAISMAAEEPDTDPLPPETFLACLYCWFSLHGFVSLEAYGHLDWLPASVQDAVLDSTVRAVAAPAGLPKPKQP